MHLAATLAEPTACASEDSRLWISEDRDEREWAAALCVSSPLLVACRQASRGEVFGVRGGRDRSSARAAALAGPEFESGLLRSSLHVSDPQFVSGHNSGHNAADRVVVPRATDPESGAHGPHSMKPPIARSGRPTRTNRGIASTSQLAD